MKVRKGFVSNSSSSSFVIVGCEVDKNLIFEKTVDKETTYYTILEKLGVDFADVIKSDKETHERYHSDEEYVLDMEDLFFDKLREIENDSKPEDIIIFTNAEWMRDSSNKVIIGMKVGETDECYNLEDATFDLTELIVKIRNKALEFGVEDVDIKLIMGTMSC